MDQERGAPRVDGGDGSCHGGVAVNDLLGKAVELLDMQTWRLISKVVVRPQSTAVGRCCLRHPGLVQCSREIRTGHTRAA